MRRYALLAGLFLLVGCASNPERMALKQADSLIDQGQIRAALDLVENYLHQHPDSVPFQRMRVVVLLRAERIDLAAIAVRQIPTGRSILPQLLHHRNPMVRANAAKLISEQPSKDDSRDLIRAVDDPDPVVRRYCARALGRLKNPNAVRPLFRLLADDNWFVRAEAATGLGEIGDPRAVGWLIQLLADGDGYVRYSAVSALHKLASDSTHELLLRALSSVGPKQKFGIAIALAKLHDPAALEPLINAAGDKDTDIRSIEYSLIKPAPP